MPKYRNTSGDNVIVDGITFQPNEELSVYKILTNDNLTRTSNAPYYNPVNAVSTVSGTSETVETSITVTSKFLRISPVSGDATVYLNSTHNTPGMDIDTTIVISNNGRIEKIYTTFTGSGSILVEEINSIDNIKFSSGSGSSSSSSSNNTTVVESTPTIGTAIYASGDLIGGKISLANATSSVGSGIIQSITLIDDDAEEAAVDIIFFDTDPSNTTFTDNAALDIADADLENFIGFISVSSADYISFNDNSAASVQNIGLAFDLPSGTTLYAAIVSRDTPTYTTTSDLTLRIGILSD